MDNVPSSAILAIVAIVAACLLGAFIFTTVQSQKESGNQAIAKTEAMNTSLDESTFTQYDGATVTGSQVLSAIKLMKTEGVVVVVDNGSGVAQYLNQLDTFKTQASGTTAVTMPTTDEISTADNSGDKGLPALHAKNAPDSNKGAYSYMVKEAKNKSDTAMYITPSANYTGGIIRSASNGSIIGVTFQKQKTSTTKP